MMMMTTTTTTIIVAVKYVKKLHLTCLWVSFLNLCKKEEFPNPQRRAAQSPTKPVLSTRASNNTQPSFYTNQRVSSLKSFLLSRSRITYPGIRFAKQTPDESSEKENCRFREHGRREMTKAIRFPSISRERQTSPRPARERSPGIFICQTDCVSRGH
jgi:hypothetical protein